MWWIASVAFATEPGASLEARWLIREEPPLASASLDPPGWIVRRGSGPALDTPTLLQLLDEPGAWSAYERLQRSDLVLGAGLAAGSGLALVAGATAAIVGGTLVFEPAIELGGRPARIGVPLTVAGGATALIASGTVWLSAVPWSRRRLREQRPDSFLDADQVDLYIDDHNQRLEAEPDRSAPAAASLRPL